MSTPGDASEPERTPTLSFDKQAAPSEPADRIEPAETVEDDVVEPPDGDRPIDVLNPNVEQHEQPDQYEQPEQPLQPEQPIRQPEPAITLQRPVRMRTVVVGLVLAVIAGSVLVNQLTEVRVDAGAVFLAVMIGGGVLLIIGAAPRLGRARRAS